MGCTKGASGTSGKLSMPRRKLNWDKNPTWTSLAVQILDEDDGFCLKLFSGDSMSDAKAEERKKVQGKSTKMSL
jgi:hypothetical protein